jgi:type II secretory pathway pseudopilin PulG
MVDERRHPRKEEDGALLLILMVGVAVMSIGVGVAAQAWSTIWRRDSEEELIFRGGQYVDAILAYRKEHGGQFPTDLTELMKLGPRQLRYIRKLYRDPINPTGQWGLLYLVPGGQGIYDAVLAARQKSDAEKSGEGATVAGGMPGVTPITYNPAGTPGVGPAGLPGAPGAGGAAGRPGGARAGLGRGMDRRTFTPGLGQVGGPGQPGAVPGGGPGVTVGAPAARPASGEFSEEEPSEPPIGWPIVGVISRASETLADKTFKIYKGHDKINEWQFHVFDRGIDQQQTPAGTVPAAGPRSIGPGYGGGGPIGGIGGGPLPPGKRLPNWPQQRPPNWQPGPVQK